MAPTDAGPGDPQLVTLKATEILKKADCVFYDYLVDPSLLKYAPKAEHIYVGKRKGSHALSQAELSRQLRLKAMSGKCVVRLKGGDPFLFGRGGEEALHLRERGVAFETVDEEGRAHAVEDSAHRVVSDDVDERGKLAEAEALLAQAQAQKEAA